MEGVAALSELRTRETPRATWRHDRRFLAGVSLLYLGLSLVVLFSVDRFWSANWDVEIFLGAARSFYDGGSLFDLYEKSRQQFYWPYPYPPLYAMVLAPFVWLADLSFMPAWAPLVAVRLPVFIADVGLAWTLYAIVWHATARRPLARLAAVAWLFTPILFYQTAIQAHQESVWLWPAVLAYWHVVRKDVEQTWLPATLLSVAIALKQSAVLYAIPFGLYLLWRRRWKDVGVFGFLFLLIFGGLALPFHLYSDDFFYMVFVDVPNMPVQTQSWIVWLLAFKGYLIEQTRSTFPLIRYASAITLATTALVSALWLFRRREVLREAPPHRVTFAWFAPGVLVTLAFFLTSQKVMAYHYPMLVPWLLAALLSVGRVRLVTATLLWVSWIVVSPYYAPWANPERLPLYASLGTLNSLFFLGLLIALFRIRLEALPGQDGQEDAVASAVGWLFLLMAGFVLSALAHPLTTLVEERGPARQALIFGLLALVFGLMVSSYAALRRTVGRLTGVDLPPLRAAHVMAALWFAPLFFTWFAMTREITYIIEKGLWKAWKL